MMEQAKKLLADIIQAVNLIESFIRDTPSFDLYSSDAKTRSAVERQLGIVGEAVGKFEKKFPSERFQFSKEITGFRNRLIHAYDNIDDAIVWAILVKYIPKLKEEAENKLAKLEL